MKLKGPAKWSRPWLIGWLAIFVAFTGYELWGVFSGDSATPPLTQVIHRYVSPAYFFAGLGALSVWLLWHFLATFRSPKP